MARSKKTKRNIKRPHFRANKNYPKYPKGSSAGNWLVPTEDEHACIYHGHADETDHSLCGPYIFCCAAATELFVNMQPVAIPSGVEWVLIKGTHLISWIKGGPKIFYFFFCHPDNSDVLLFKGIHVPEVNNVLLMRTSLENYIDDATPVG